MGLLNLAQFKSLTPATLYEAFLAMIMKLGVKRDAIPFSMLDSCENFVQSVTTTGFQRALLVRLVESYVFDCVTAIHPEGMTVDGYVSVDLLTPILQAMHRSCRWMTGVPTSEFVARYLLQGRNSLKHVVPQSVDALCDHLVWMCTRLTLVSG
eukprot:EC800136.1.p2 GENE.EC800136.1~~EC800136.1.p2  ORF type:complete len:153 (+),score=35.81 EC800136.1:287-745(+)